MPETIEDLDAVRAFVRVVQAGSFTAAAARLGMPKSTVSRRVAGLEEALGARLLHRTTRRLRLTDVGSVYFARAERALSALEEAERALTDLQDVPRGPLRLSAPVDLALSVLPAIVRDFQRQHPQVDVHVDASNRHVDLIADGFDLALRASARLRDTSLVARKLIRSDSGLYASPQYLKTRGAPARVAELAEHDFLLLGGDRFETSLKLLGPDGAESVAVRGHISSNDMGFLRRMAEAGTGIAALPFFEAAASAAAGRLRRVLPQHRAQAGNVWAVYPSPRHLTPKVRAFIDFVALRLGELNAPYEATLARRA